MNLSYREIDLKDSDYVLIYKKKRGGGGMKKLSLFCAVGLCFASFAFSEELEFDSLEISGSKIKNDEKHFVTPGATSTRERG